MLRECIIKIFKLALMFSYKILIKFLKFRMIKMVDEEHTDMLFPFANVQFISKHS